jgi:hypothetical protein
MPGDRSLGGRDCHKDSAFGCHAHNRNLLVGLDKCSPQIRS